MPDNVLYKRLISGFGANIYGQVVVAVTQILSIPILLRSWTVSEYGYWVMLMSVPSYLVLADIGLSTVGGNRMMAALARDDQEECGRLYNCILIGSVYVSAAAVIGIVFVSLLASVLIAGVRVLEIALVALYAALLIINNATMAAHRALGNYGGSTFVVATTMLAETVVLLAVVVSGGGILATAATLPAVRIFGVIWLHWRAEISAPWAKISRRKFNLSKTLGLMPSGLATLALPLGSAIKIQGAVLVVGALISPAAAGAFAAVRSLTRAGLQIPNIVARVLVVEVPDAKARGDGRRLGRLVGLCLATSLVLSVSVAATVIALAEPIETHWLAIPLDRTLLALLAGNAAAQALWWAVFSILISMDEHVGYARFFLVTAVAELGLFAIACVATDLSGAAGILFAVDVILVAVGLFALFRRRGLFHLRQRATI